MMRPSLPREFRELPVPDRIERLRPEEIHKTIEALGRRIEERFPESGLGKVCQGILQVSQESDATIRHFRRPILWVRALVVLTLALILSSLVLSIISVRISEQEMVLREWIQVTEPGLNILVYLGVVILFLVTLETRIKRRRIVRALHRIRSIAHIIDMHQLTKDPETTLRPDLKTASSPRRDLTPFELHRYLDYSSEMLSLLGKLAALYAQDFDDPVATGIVNELENLTTGLSRKIWQKIVILDRQLAVERGSAS